MKKHVAIYVRVSTKSQKTRSQEPDLKRWEASQDEPVKWYTDQASGLSMERPAWSNLEEAIRLGRVSKVVVWRIDRLGRTVSGLSKLFDFLRTKKIGLVSLKDGLDLTTAAGTLLANILASVAQFETEVRGERVAAGQAAARAAGKTWGGSLPGVRKKVKPEQERTIVRMHTEGEAIAAISRVVKLSRPTIYSVLADAAKPAKRRAR